MLRRKRAWKMNLFRFFKPGVDLKKSGLTKYQLWCNGLCGILTELNGGNHFELEMIKLTRHNIDKARACLVEGWSILGRNDLFSSLRWLEEEGHNESFEDLAALFEENPEISDAELEFLCEEYGLIFNQVDCVRKHYQIVGTHYIKAWDLGRYVFLCRMGYICHYLTREEALTLMEGIGRKVREEFHSWQEFGENYCIGRRFWAADEPENELAIYNEAMVIFEELMSEDGAWAKIPWSWANC